VLVAVYDGRTCENGTLTKEKALKAAA